MKKNNILLMVSIAVSIALSSAVLAEDTQRNDFKGVEISLVIGENKAFLKNDATENDIILDVKPFIENNRTYTPARFVAEALGAEVEWNGDTNQITIEGGETSIVLTIGSKTAEINGEVISIDAPAIIKYNRTFTPVRFVAEALGASVYYNSEDSTIGIVKEGSIVSRITEMGTPVPETVKVNIAGYVYDSSTHEKLPGASVVLGNNTTVSNADGFYCFNVEPGAYGMAAVYDEHYDYWQSVIVPECDYWYDVYMDSNAVDYSKYIGSFEGLFAETYATLTITELDSSGGTFYFDTANFKRVMFRGPFKAAFDNKGDLTGKGYNSYGRAYETFSITFSGDIITVKSGDFMWTYDINSHRIPMIDVTLDH